MAQTQTIMQLKEVDLENKIKSMYKNVAQRPDDMYHFELGKNLAIKLGYPENILEKIPGPAIDSFAGVGYSFDLVTIKPGQIVLDLGSGSGMDLFYASILVGETGKVVGVDITPEQIEKAMELANKYGFSNISIKKAYIEDLPFADNTFDVIISNGVINLAPDKIRVFKEISRVLKPGGKLAFSDIITLKSMPESIVCNAKLWASCIGGATQLDDLMEYIEAAGLFLTFQKYNREYKFLSNSAKGASNTYGVQSHSFLAEKIKL